MLQTRLEEPDANRSTVSDDSAAGRAEQRAVTVLRVVALLALGYLAVCLLLYLFQNRLLFFPQPQWRTPEGPHVQPVALPRPDVTLRGWLVNPDSSGPLIVYFGGNAEELSTAVATFAQLEAATVLINYRGFGRSGGSPTVSQLSEDAAAVVAAAHARWGGGRPLVLFGRSIGTGFAAAASGAAPLSGMVLMSPFPSLEQLARRHLPFVPVGWLLRERLEPASTVATLPERVLVLYGTRDRIVPPDYSRAFAERLEGGARVVAFEGGHNVPLTHRDIWPALQAFLASLSAG
jgi:hypothetical protein